MDNTTKYLLSAVLIVLGILAILVGVGKIDIPNTNRVTSSYESMYIGSEGYRIYEFERHGNCYELLTRGNNSFAIKIDCEKGE